MSKKRWGKIAICRKTMMAIVTNKPIFMAFRKEIGSFWAIGANFNCASSISLFGKLAKAALTEWKLASCKN